MIPAATNKRIQFLVFITNRHSMPTGSYRQDVTRALTAFPPPNYDLRPPRKCATNLAPIGRVAEWLKAPDSKSGVRVTVPWVQIPPLPPEIFQVEILFATL